MIWFYLLLASILWAVCGYLFIGHVNKGTYFALTRLLDDVKVMGDGGMTVWRVWYEHWRAIVFLSLAVGPLAWLDFGIRFLRALAKE